MRREASGAEREARGARAQVEEGLEGSEAQGSEKSSKREVLGSEGAQASSSRLSIFETELFKRCRSVSGFVWTLVNDWPMLAKDTLGKQWIRSTDSIGANLVEGDGRGSDQDSLRFFVIARASLRESRYWLLLASDRLLIDTEPFRQAENDLDEIGRMLNGFIAYRKRALGTPRVHEERAPYEVFEGSSPPYLSDLESSPTTR